jgi:hypothetical protein
MKTPGRPTFPQMHGQPAYRRLVMFFLLTGYRFFRETLMKTPLP